MIRVMTKTTKGSPNGIRIVEYLEGETYNLPEKLALVFDGMGVCKPVVPVAPKEPEVKKMPGAPSNKMMGVADNKQLEEKPEEKPEKKKKAAAIKRRR